MGHDRSALFMISIGLDYRVHHEIHRPQTFDLAKKIVSKLVKIRVGLFFLISFLSARLTAVLYSPERQRLASPLEESEY